MVKLIENNGWQRVRTRVSHRQFKHPTKPATVTVLGKLGLDTPRGTFNSVMKQAGLKCTKGSEVRYAVILEQSKDGFGAYVPDLPGCVAVGETKDEALRLIGEALELHLEGLREDGLPFPEPSSSSEYVEVGAA